MVYEDQLKEIVYDILEGQDRLSDLNKYKEFFEQKQYTYLLQLILAYLTEEDKNKKEEIKEEIEDLLNNVIESINKNNNKENSTIDDLKSLKIKDLREKLKNVDKNEFHQLLSNYIEQLLLEVAKSPYILLFIDDDLFKKLHEFITEFIKIIIEDFNISRKKRASKHKIADLFVVAFNFFFAEKTNYPTAACLHTFDAALKKILSLNILENVSVNLKDIKLKKVKFSEEKIRNYYRNMVYMFLDFVSYMNNLEIDYKTLEELSSTITELVWKVFKSGKFEMPREAPFKTDEFVLYYLFRVIIEYLSKREKDGKIKKLLENSKETWYCFSKHTLYTKHSKKNTILVAENHLEDLLRQVEEILKEEERMVVVCQ